jgi:hypothetical protein
LHDSLLREACYSTERADLNDQILLERPERRGHTRSTTLKQE